MKISRTIKKYEKISKKISEKISKISKIDFKNISWWVKWGPTINQININVNKKVKQTATKELKK
jgi:hypothetical protein